MARVRRIPFLPTLFVLAAVATMVGLGVWQLQRAEWKTALLARYEGARTLAPIPLPAEADPANAFRFSTADCRRPDAVRPVAGRNRESVTGWSHVVDCPAPEGAGPGFSVDIGWSRQARTDIAWRGGEVLGVLVPTGDGGQKLVAAQAAPGLEPSQPPGPFNVTKNNVIYSAQWFFFALAALTIYGLALRNRWNAKPA